MKSESFTRYFAYKVPDEDQSLEKRFHWESERFALDENDLHEALRQIVDQQIVDYAIGHSHIAFLTVTGQLGRIRYKIIETTKGAGKGTDSACTSDANGNVGQAGRSSSASSTPSQGGPSNSGDGPGGNNGGSGNSSSSLGAAIAAAAAAVATSNAGNTAAGSNSVGGGPRGPKIRRVMLTRGRVGRSMLVNSRPLIPASSVPEELIAEAQAVLQGKPREVILRELQRTNCDVNQAVNNLLSREDDNEVEDIDDTGESLFPEELISLLDTSVVDHPNVIINADPIFAEDLWSVTLRRRVHDKTVCDVKQSDGQKEAAGTNTSQLHKTSVLFDPRIEMWPSVPPCGRFFRCIGAMHSELVAVDSSGVLCQWRWDDVLPAENPEHPKCSKLRLNGEVIKRIACSSARTTLLTQSKKVASFMDASLDMISELLDTACMSLTEVPISVYSCSLYSCAQVQSGALYWWGVMPTKQRMKMIENAKNKAKKQFSFGIREIGVGSLVKMRSSPIFLADAIGFSMVDGFPQIALLLDNVWSSSDSARFQVITSAKSKAETGDNASARLPETSSDEPVANASSRKRFYADHHSYKERTWNLQNVVILEENRNATVGKVMMVDGPYCAVAFTDSSGKINENKECAKDWRLLHKDELVLTSKVMSASSVPDYVIREPRKLDLCLGDCVIDVAAESSGIWCLYHRQRDVVLSKLSFSGKTEAECVVCRDAESFLEGGASRSISSWLVNCDEDSVIYVLDGHCSVVPILKTSSLKPADPCLFSGLTVFSVGMAPISPSSSGSGADERHRSVVTLFTHSVNTLIKAVLNCDLDAVKRCVAEAETSKTTDALKATFLSSRIGGGRNLLHACVAMYIPPTNRANYSDADDGRTPIGSGDYSQAAASARAMFDARWEQMIASSRAVGEAVHYGSRARHMNVGLLVPSLFLEDGSVNSQSGGETAAVAERQPSPPLPHGVLTDPKDRQRGAYKILKFFCGCELLAPELSKLLRHKNTDGLTPFMYALETRSYRMALLLWQTIQSAALGATVPNELLTAAIYPKNSRPEDCPLYVIARSDTCSFTWTGDEHINQDIFECRTCGLVGSLCCCTECAYVCHKGHDCTLKRTSPTAYCDCWERCKCKSLIAGSQDVRLELLRYMANLPALHSVLNNKNEHILLFLARTLTRQMAEQRQCHILRGKSESRHLCNQPVRMPECDLEPPRFAQRALEALLSRGDVVTSMINVGLTNVNPHARVSEAQYYLLSQEGVTFIDRFMYYLLVKLPMELLETFLKTIGVEIRKMGKWDLSSVYFRRVARSAIRVFTLLAMGPQFMTNRKKSIPMNRCRRVFNLLLPYTVVELAAAANGILAPVRYNTVKLTESFSFPNNVDTTALIEKLFMLEPACFPRQGINVGDRLYRSDYMWDAAGHDGSSLAESDHESDSENGASSPSKAGPEDSAVATHRLIRRGTGPFSDAESDESDDAAGGDPQDVAMRDEDAVYHEGAEAAMHDQADDDEEEDEEEGDSDGSSDLYDVNKDDSDHESFTVANNNDDHRNRDGRDTPVVPRTLPLIKTTGKGIRTNDAQEQMSNVPMTVMLARLFNVYVRELTSLMVLAADSSSTGHSKVVYPVPLTDEVGLELQTEVEKKLASTWQWLYPIMDSCEATLRFSASLCAARKCPAEELRRKRDGSFSSVHASDKSSAKASATKDIQVSLYKGEDDELRGNQRLEAMLYVTSLLRLNASEHGEDLPHTDLSSMKHVALAVDALLHSMNTTMHLLYKVNGQPYYSFFNAEPNALDHPDMPPKLDRVFSHDVAGDLAFINEQNPFFSRSDSMIYPGLWPIRHSFSHSPVEHIPLSSKPYLLLPSACRESLFGLQKLPCTWEEQRRTNELMGNCKPAVASLAAAEMDCAATVSGVGKSIWGLKVGRREEGVKAASRPTTVIVHANTAGETADDAMDIGDAPTTSIDNVITSSEEQLLCNREQIQMLMSRWRFTLSAFAKFFQEDLSSDPLSFVYQLSGFNVKAVRFRKLADKYRNSLAKDLNLEVERSRGELLVQTFRQLNMYSERRSLATDSRQSVAVHRLKVSFKNEQGEGSGVTRSFYTAIAEAILSPDPLPDLQSTVNVLPLSAGRSGAQLRNRYQRDGSMRRRIYPNIRGLNLSVTARSFVPFADSSAAHSGDGGAGSVSPGSDGVEATRQSFGERLYPRVSALYPSYAPKLTGMLLELPAHHILLMLSNQQLLKANCDVAHDILLTFTDADPAFQNASSQEGPATPGNQRCTSCPNLVNICDNGDMDQRPLFFQPSGSGFYAPLAGRDSTVRLNAYRNVGRLIGLCLLHNEVMPLPLCRSVFKFILGRSINWYDMAFYDLHMYENFYKMVRGEFKPEDLHLAYTITLDPLEGGHTVPLIENGADIPVTSHNVMEYVYYYSSYRMVTVCARALESIRDGVYDVLPTYMLEGLTAEDFRLLLAGNMQLNMKSWQESTFFTDETSASMRKLMQPEKMAQFKRWFWSVVAGMTAEEKQDLIQFWTGSTAIPASSDGPNPVPNVVVRPPDDNYLPTANTCISRLYIPLYSSKAIMRQKLLMAIKVQTFGFV